MGHQGGATACQGPKARLPGDDWAVAEEPHLYSAPSLRSVEYALRDTAKPMGVADYRVSSSLPARLERDLPTSADLAGEFPLMSLVKLRLEIEQQLRLIAAGYGFSGRAAGIGLMLRELQRAGVLPSSAQAFQETLQVLNQASLGMDVAPEAADSAVAAGTTFLEDLRNMKYS